MIRLRILAAVLALTGVVSTTLGRANIICVESSGRISYGCNDLFPDEMIARLALPVTQAASSQDCEFCQDYVVGQAVTQSFHTLALPLALVGVCPLVLPQHVSILQAQSSPVAFLDTSGCVSPLKC